MSSRILPSEHRANDLHSHLAWPLHGHPRIDVADPMLTRYLPGLEQLLLL